MSARHINRTLGLTLFGIVCLAAVIGLLYTPFDPIEPDFGARLHAPSSTHWWGTDQYGRDLFSRVLAGAATSLLTALFSVSLALILGVVAGALGGYWGGIGDRILTVAVDSMLAFPGLLLALGLMAAFGPSMSSVVLAIGIAFAPSVARVVRGIVLSVREKDFIEASRALGNSRLYTLFRHVLPNCVSPLVALTTSLLAGALLIESALSFLGLGVPPPAATWGGLLADGRQFIGTGNWLMLFPGIAISASVLGINLLGDALRDRLDPRMAGL